MDRLIDIAVKWHGGVFLCFCDTGPEGLNLKANSRKQSEAAYTRQGASTSEEANQHRCPNGYESDDSSLKWLAPTCSESVAV
jgi:hypothetical protein